ncbi:MAG: hypothetical protein H0U69_09540 [Trueperaceae bacterium]|nr:hypothetical protein [Trueperaceae bacterium]
MRPRPSWTEAPWWRRAARALWLLVALALLPAAALVVARVGSEGTQRSVAIVMDEIALAEQASYLGVSSFELGMRYGALGLGGIALYEETVETLALKGRAAAMLGREARAVAAAAGQVPTAIPADATLVRELEPGALDVLLATSWPPAQAVEILEQTWYFWPGDSFRTRPAGPDREQIEAWHAAGFDIAYRPRNFPNLREVGAYYPPEARYLIYGGLQVAGFPNSLDDAVAASGDYLTGIIEGTAQDGMPALARQVPTARLLSFNQDYINQRLRPADLIEKYLLAANERNVRILYLRPYTEEQLGDMIENTEAMIAGLVTELEREGFVVGSLASVDVTYAAPTYLRALAAVGVFAGLGLLALAFPTPWGVYAALSVALLALAAAGPSWAALALIAALVFPVLGYALFGPGLLALLRSTGISLLGAAFLVAVGSDRDTMLAIEPFAGVAATLVVPPALFAAHALLRWRRPSAWVRYLWGYRVRLGDLAVAVAVAAVLALVVIRRGNFPILGASEAELALRGFLNELFVRPRFKELVGHPLAVVALMHARWPGWATAPLLVAGVVAQASILNSFSHYHTPLVVSFQRTLIALVIGLAVGLVLVPLVRLAIRAIGRWLASADTDRAPTPPGSGGARAAEGD